MILMKKIGTAALALAFAASLAVPALALAQAAPAATEAQETETSSDESTEHSGPGTCTAYIRYYENVGSDVPGITPDENGRLLLGTRVVSGLHEGDVLNAWDYVEDIPGHFFFDGWPLNLTISANPADNVIDLFYFNMNNSEFTVNYYVMTGADLTADNWIDALAPESVRIDKVGSQTFENQRFDQLVKADAYEYQLEGVYVVDSYPSEIRLGTEPDDNVINVLYTTAVDNAPLDTPIAEKPETPENPSDPDTPDAPTPDGSGTTTPGASDDDSSEATPDLPSDTTMEKDELLSALPASAQADPELIHDFVGSEGNTLGTTLTQTGDEMGTAVIAMTSIAAVAVAVLLIALFWRKSAPQR